MPIGISIIIMPKPLYKTARELTHHIDAYFKHLECVDHTAGKTVLDEKEHSVSKKIKDRESASPTIAGLALFLGFDSKKAFDDYKGKGKFASALRRGCLRVEAAYEKKLHGTSATGAIFALKSMGWHETDDGGVSNNKQLKSLKVTLDFTGPKPVDDEKEVIL